MSSVYIIPSVSLCISSHIILHIPSIHLCIFLVHNVFSEICTYNIAPDLDIRVWIEQNGVTTTSDNIDSFTYDSDGSNLTIHCQFDASSNPRVEWHRNGEIITEGVSNQDNVSILRIEDFDNISTIYQCHVDNRYVYVYATMVLCKQLKGM